MNTLEAIEAVRRMSDRELVVAYNHYNNASQRPLPVADSTRNFIIQRCWELQDGYGTPGFTPPQGWDWSGIRDSSDQAMRKMAQSIRYTLVGVIAAAPDFLDGVTPVTNQRALIEYIEEVNKLNGVPV